MARVSRVEAVQEFKNKLVDFFGPSNAPRWSARDVGLAILDLYEEWLKEELKEREKIKRASFATNYEKEEVKQDDAERTTNGEGVQEKANDETSKDQD